ncbi:hypothetical protein L600_001500000430 [Isoptericola variabilis J7]|uniref:Phosphodiesterase n=1 Tax=Isoptericola variabilis (strain 225) TaxID=743718 RepID=F6FV52_ISOV2|nr:hypothetical protein Isova_2791 [Isoptericola variabilis 225]TWH33832.1 hypothetical protein L600_001500000430 [Isoptericola variabilis J7]
MRTVTRLMEHTARGAGAALAGVVAAVALARRRRPLHPRGVLLDGVLEAVDPRAASVLPARRTEVLVRLSVSVGMPRGLPDVVGVAVRWTDDGAPQDVLFASTGRGRLTRYVLTARRRLTGGWLTTLMPLRAPWGPVLLALRPATTVPGRRATGTTPASGSTRPSTRRGASAATAGRTRCAPPRTPSRGVSCEKAVPRRAAQTVPSSSERRRGSVRSSGLTPALSA